MLILDAGMPFTQQTENSDIHSTSATMLKHEAAQDHHWKATQESISCSLRQARIYFEILYDEKPRRTLLQTCIHESKTLLDAALLSSKCQVLFTFYFPQSKTDGNRVHVSPDSTLMRIERPYDEDY